MRYSPAALEERHLHAVNGHEIFVRGPLLMRSLVLRAFARAGVLAGAFARVGALAGAFARVRAFNGLLAVARVGPPRDL